MENLKFEKIANLRRNLEILEVKNLRKLKIEKTENSENCKQREFEI